MNSIDLTTLTFTLLPSIITGGVAYYFFNIHIKNEENRRNYILLKENKKATLPIKLQAYERIILFLERMNPSQLLVRVKPLGDNKEAYSSLLLSTIEQEYEHNLSQQIYISEECWNVIVSSKNTTSHIISKATANTAIKNAQELREDILKKMVDSTPPSAVAISFVKSEVQKIL